jgi:hypothetical protein
MQPDPDQIVTIMPGEVHVYPLFGREHKLDNDCWCQPERDPQEPTLLLHHPEH